MERYFRSALAPSSQRTYVSAQTRYLQFCSSFSLSPLPVNELQLCQFAAHLANEQLSHTTIKSYLSAVRHLQIASNLADPHISDMPKLEGVMKGIKSGQAKTKQNQRTRLPITPKILLQMCNSWEQQVNSNRDNTMLWAAATLCFFGFLRSGEATVPSDGAFDSKAHMTYEDVSVDNIGDPQTIKVRLKASKTDPFRKGVDIVIGRTQNKLCPVTAMLAYLVMRGPKPGFLFQFSDGRLLTKSRFVEAVRQVLSTIGLNPLHYAGHSFRIGAATAASTCGLNDSTIQMLGRWSSSAYLSYIRTPRDNLASFSGIIGRAEK